jgi:DNA replication protein DnaC
MRNHNSTPDRPSAAYVAALGDGYGARPRMGDAHVASVANSPANSATASAPGPKLCPLCSGLGFVRADVPVGHPLFGQALPCRCTRRRRRAREEEALRSFSQREVFARHTFATFRPEVPGVAEAFIVARDFAARLEGWLVLCGPAGVGKTHLAAAIAHAAAERGVRCHVAVVADLLDHLRAAHDPRASVGHDELFERIRAVDLLMLDDLGAEYATPWASEKLFQLVNGRYTARAPMVVTANQRMLAHLDERLRSRLADASLVRTVTIVARDYRPRAAPPGFGRGKLDRPAAARATFILDSG